MLKNGISPAGFSFLKKEEEEGTTRRKCEKAKVNDGGREDYIFTSGCRKRRNSIFNFLIRDFCLQ